MFEVYLPILLMSFVAIGFGLILFVLSYLLGYVKKSKTSLKTYECGMPLLDEAQKRISIRYYVVLLLFLIFDIEALLLFPICAVFKEFIREGKEVMVFFEFTIFIVILFIGYLYLYKKGAFKWE